MRVTRVQDAKFVEIYIVRIALEKTRLASMFVFVVLKKSRQINHCVDKDENNVAKIVIESKEALEIIRKYFESKGMEVKTSSFVISYTGKVDYARFELKTK